jgi:hypothetical protein
MTDLHLYFNQQDYENLEDIKKLHVFLDELDRRRGTNWRNIFSYLDISK